MGSLVCPTREAWVVMFLNKMVLRYLKGKKKKIRSVMTAHAFNPIEGYFPSIAIAILFHACQLFHIVTVICLPVTDTEQGQVDHIHTLLCSEVC